MKIKINKILSNTRELGDEEFRVYFFILNSINMNSNDIGEVKICRAILAELTGKSERTISRITEKLEEKGLIEVQRCTKQSNVYRLPTSKTVTCGTLKEYKEIKEKKENKENISCYISGNISGKYST